MAGSTFYGSTAVKIVYTPRPYIVVGAVTSKSQSILRAVRANITENLYAGSVWETEYFEAEDAINVTITGGNSLTAPIFEFVILRSGAYLR